MYFECKKLRATLSRSQCEANRTPRGTIKVNASCKHCKGPSADTSFLTLEELTARQEAPAQPARRVPSILSVERKHYKRKSDGSLICD